MTRVIFTVHDYSNPEVNQSRSLSLSPTPPSEATSSSSRDLTTDTPEPKRKRVTPKLKGAAFDPVDEAILKGLKSLDKQREERREQKRQAEQSENAKVQQDEEYLFGLQIASTLRRLPRCQRALAKINIQQMLFHMEFPENPGTSGPVAPISANNNCANTGSGVATVLPADYYDF